MKLRTWTIILQVSFILFIHRELVKFKRPADSILSIEDYLHKDVCRWIYFKLVDFIKQLQVKYIFKRNVIRFYVSVARLIRFSIDSISHFLFSFDIN